MANIRYERLTTLLTPQFYNIIFLSFKLQWYLLYFKDHCICFSPVPYCLGTLQNLSVSICSLVMKTRLVPCIFAVFLPWEIKISSWKNEKPIRTPRKVRLNRIASLIVNGCRDRLRLTPDCISLGFYYKHRTTEITRQHRRVTTAAKRWPLASAPVSLPLFACLVDCSQYTRRIDCVYIYSMFRNFSGN